MNAHTWLWLEALGHWLLAWTVVVSVVSSCFVLTKVRRPGIRYVGWLLATFSGAAFLPVVIGLSPVFSWREVTGYAGVMPTINAGFPDDLPAPAKDDMNATPPATGATEPVLHDALGGHFSWLQLIFAIWIGGAAFLAIRLVRAGSRVRRLLAESEVSVPEELISEFKATREQLGVNRNVHLVANSRIVVPMCSGFIRPTLFWPSTDRHPMNPALCRAVLVHELTHLQRYDDWVRLAGELWRILCWFYVPIHWAFSRLQREQEFLSDEAAALTLDRPETYAQLLLDHTSVRLPSPLLSSSFAGGCPMTNRVRHILRDELRRRPLGWKQGALLTALSVLLLVAAGSLRLVGSVSAAEASAADERPTDTIADRGPQTDREVDSDVAPNTKDVPDTTDWKVLFSDDFEQDELGKSWKPTRGQWMVEDGHLKGQLVFRRKWDQYGGAVQNTAFMHLTKPILPETVEIRYETWFPDPMSSECGLGNSEFKRGLIIAFLGVEHPALRTRGLVTLHAKQVEGQPRYEGVGRQARDIVITAKDRHRVRVVRQPEQLYVFLDDKLISEVDLSWLEDLPPLNLRLYGTWGKEGMPIYFDNVEIRAPSTEQPLP